MVEDYLTRHIDHVAGVEQTSIDECRRCAERGTGAVPDALGLIQADADAARATVYNMRARAAGDGEGGDE